MLESEVWSEDPGRGQLLAVKKPEGEGVRSSTTRKVCRGSLGHQRSKVSLLSGAQEVGPTLQPPSPPEAAASTGTGSGTHLSSLVCPSNQGLLLKPEQAQVLTTAHAKASSGISPESPFLRQESTKAGRGRVLKRGVKGVSGERAAISCVNTTKRVGKRGSMGQECP